MTDRLVRGDDGILRCAWGASSPDYCDYHDREWGFPVLDDTRLFEKLSLEGFQAGLSWLTILRKREAFRHAFAGFDFNAVARFDERDVERLLGDAGIVRHRGKIEAVINNAQRAVELVGSEGSLAAFVWRYEPERPGGRGEILSETAESKALAKELKRRGWRFVGPTTVYAFMQAMGLVNDHAEGCPRGPRSKPRAPSSNGRRSRVRLTADQQRDPGRAPLDVPRRVGDRAEHGRRDPPSCSERRAQPAPLRARELDRNRLPPAGAEHLQPGVGRERPTASDPNPRQGAREAAA